MDGPSFNLPGQMPVGQTLGDITPQVGNLPHPKFFSKDGAAPYILAAISDAFAMRNGGQGHAVQNILDMSQNQEAQSFDREKWAAKLEADRQEKLAPRIEQVGSALGYLNPDPANPGFTPFYRQPQPFESYAEAQGFKPGSPEYASAVQNYRLGSWSDPAMENRERLAGVNYGYRDELQDQRLGVTRRGQDLAHADRGAARAVSRDNSVRSSDTRRGAYSYSHPTGRGGNGPEAVGPDGHKIVVRDGKWVDAVSGKPVQ